MNHRATFAERSERRADGHEAIGSVATEGSGVAARQPVDGASVSRLARGDARRTTSSSGSI